MALVPNEQDSPTSDEVTTPLLNITPPVVPNPAAHRFVSLRWRLLVPIALVVLVMSIVGAYTISHQLTASSNANTAAQLTAGTENALQKFDALQQRHVRELFRLQNTGGFAESVASRDVGRLEALISPNALLAELDVVIVTDRTGVEIMGLQRTSSTTPTLELSQQGDLSQVSSIDTLLNTATATTELVRLNNRLILLSGASILAPNEQIMGTLLVGTDVAPTLASITQATEHEALLFAANGQWLAGTAAGASIPTEPNAASVINSTDFLQVSTVEGDSTFFTVYAPLRIGNTPLAVLRLNAEQRDDTVAAMTQHTVSLMAAGSAAVIVIVAALLVARLIERIEHVRDTAVALAEGETAARADLPASDEIGELATALDYFADVMHYEQTTLAANLQLHLKETKRLKAIIESINDGLIVLDPHGRPLTMNMAARKLLGIHAEFDLRELYDQIFDTLGTAIAPGIYSLGKPVRIAHDERILQAETAAVVGAGEQRLGVIVTLRDVSEAVAREQHYERLIAKLATDIQRSMAYTAQGAALEAARNENNPNREALFKFARDVARNAHALQGVIDEMQDLQQFSAAAVERVQAPLLLTELLWETASEWQADINNAQMHLSMVIPDDKHYVLGDNRRLLWAFGTIIDNAIRYSERGSDLLISSEIVQDGQSAHLIFKDSGLGILPEDLPHVFERFFRGEVRHYNGRLIEQPGTGQGLYQAKRIVEAHGGTISLESTLHVGTTVHVWLPLTADVALPLPDSSHNNAHKAETHETSIIPRVFRLRQLFGAEQDAD